VQILKISALAKDSKLDQFALFLRLGNIYLKAKRWGNASQIFIKACQSKNCSFQAWLGLGKAYYRLEMYKEVLTQVMIYRRSQLKP